MNLIVWLNAVSMVFIILALGTLGVRKVRKSIPMDFFFPAVCLLVFGLFSAGTNFLEWSNMAPYMDRYGDMIEILQPILFAVLVYAMLQHRQREQILVGEAKYRLLVDNQSDLIVKLDAKGNFLFVSPSYCRLFGRYEKDLLGRPFLDGVLPEERQPIRREMDILFLPPYACRFRHFAQTKYGLRVLAWSCRALLNETGKPSAIVGIGRDITEQVQAEQEREKTLQRLEAKNRELQSLVYISSHDLQSPLVNIRGFAGELKTTCTQLKDALKKCGVYEQIEPLLKDVDQSLYFIDSGAEKMQILIEGLLKLSRIGSMELTLQTVHMNGLIKSILEGLRFQIQKAGCEITVDPLPPCHSDLYQVNQVFTNLVENAVKYLDPSRPGKIRITGQEKNGLCEYRVIDNGIGIPPEHHDKIFEIFHRLNPDGPVKGIGLGLAIVRRILDKLDGTIHVISDTGEGTEFVVTLPAVPAS